MFNLEKYLIIYLDFNQLKLRPIRYGPTHPESGVKPHPNSTCRTCLKCELLEGQTDLG